MYHISYNEFGAAISDFEIEKRIDAMIREHEITGNVHYATSCELFLDYVRAYIDEGKLLCKDVVFSTGFGENDRTASPNELGIVLPWPNWMETHLEVLMRLYEGGKVKIQAREKERNVN
jgi:hypothetical protein